MTRINYKSDLDFLLRLHTLDGTEAGWPQYDWSACFYVGGNRASRYAVSCRGGVAENCFEDHGAIHVVMDGHQLPPGKLMCEFRAELPDGNYPDGIRLQVSTFPTGIELVGGACDEMSSADISVILPYIKGEPGEPGAPGRQGPQGEPGADGKSSYLYAQEAGYAGTEEQFAADLAAVSGKQDKLRTSVDLDISAEGVLSLTDMAKKRLFIDLWNEAAKGFGAYNEQTGCFELNGLTDIAYEEAVRIYDASEKGLFPCRPYMYGCPSSNSQARDKFLCRTYLPIRIPAYEDFSKPFTRLFYNNVRVVTFSMAGGYGGVMLSKLGGDYAFCGCTSLRSIPEMGRWEGKNAFQNCESLEEVRLSFLQADVDFHWSPKLSLASLQYIVDKRRDFDITTGGTISITLHPDTYAQLTEELMSKAAAKQISFIEYAAT